MTACIVNGIWSRLSLESELWHICERGKWKSRGRYKTLNVKLFVIANLLTQAANLFYPWRFLGSKRLILSLSVWHWRNNPDKQEVVECEVLKTNRLLIRTILVTTYVKIGSWYWQLWCYCFLPLQHTIPGVHVSRTTVSTISNMVQKRSAIQKNYNQMRRTCTSRDVNQTPQSSGRTRFRTAREY